MLGELAPEPGSRYNSTVAGRSPKFGGFDVDVSRSATLWLLVQDERSNAPERLLPIWAQAELVGPAGAVPLASLTPRDPSGLRGGDGPSSGVRVRNPSTLVYDIAGRGFLQIRGRVEIENPSSEIGSTLNPQLHFFIFDTAPNMERLVPPQPGLPLAPAPPVSTIDAAIDRVFSHALGRAASLAERRTATRALGRAPGGTRPSAEGLADLLWAVTMTPEFQFIR
jgi:hypothetical protein